MTKLSLSQSRALHVVDALLGNGSAPSHTEAMEYEQIEAIRIGEDGNPEVYLKRVPRAYGSYTRSYH